MAQRQRRAGDDAAVGSHEQSIAQARLPLRRLDDLLRVHAGDRHGQRPSRRLLPPQRSAGAQEEMIVTDPDAFLAAYSADRYPARAASTARAAFLVGPAGATLAAESASDNRYMDLGAAIDPARALAQHAELARRLGDDVPVITFPGHADAPDG